MTQEEITRQIEQAMFQPKKVEIDDKTVEQHSLSDVIALDKYLETKKAMSRRGNGLRIGKMISGGAV